MIKKLLIANRGEIACRIMRTARRMGITTVAVYSEADADAMHVRLADEAVVIGPAPAAESYLKIEAVIEAALQSGSDAIHPGYGFLAENADFARAVNKAGLIFVGPPVDAIEAMGAKDNAKAIMAKADVPLVPGYYGTDQTEAWLVKEANAIGYPVLLKAALGGGGKGMRIVHSEAELGDAISSAKREAKSSFGDDRLLIERYLTNTRHVEVQVFADHHGNTVHLFERDCSLQRRHQKVVEEAPAPGMSESLRAQMGASAVAAAQAVGYQGAGTVEFLLAPDNQYYFMEMNTRLQVEHPVSELITGQDFVEWQIRIANGDPLPLKQDQLQISGHAVEVRLYAEDPDKDFLPSPGLIRHLKWPAVSDQVRIDAGVEAGDRVSPFYDPMIAKVICYGADREAAIDELIKTLGQTEIVGPGHNTGFLLYLLNLKVFRDGKAHTGYVDQLQPSDYAAPEPYIRQSVARAAQFYFANLDQEQKNRMEASRDPHSPWGTLKGWRLGGKASRKLRLRIDDSSYLVEDPDSEKPGFVINGQFEEISSGPVSRVNWIENELHVFGEMGPLAFDIEDPLVKASAAGGRGNPFAAPMPGKVTAVRVKPGQSVMTGDVLMVLEAMKMEHSIVAPKDGTVGDVYVKTGDQIDEGVEMLSMDAD